MMMDLKTAKLRLLQMHYEARAGHIGGNLSCLEIIWAVRQLMTPEDCFVLSKGHAAGAWYVSQWAMAPESIDLDTFHKDGTMLAGHIPNTGSLGHGLGIAAGYALHKKLNELPGVVYCLMSDGEWDEGSNWEALEFIAQQDLRVVIVVDANDWQGFKAVSATTVCRLSDYDPVVCKNGNSVELVKWYLQNFEFIWAMTTKGNGVSFLENKLESHYEPLTCEQYLKAMNEVKDAPDTC